MIKVRLGAGAAQPRIKWQPDWMAFSKDSQKDAQPVQPSRHSNIADLYDITLRCSIFLDRLPCARDTDRLLVDVALTGPL